MSMSLPIHPISEKLVSLGMVFTESNELDLYMLLSNILPTIWGDGWNPIAKSLQSAKVLSVLGYEVDSKGV